MARKIYLSNTDIDEAVVMYLKRLGKTQKRIAIENVDVRESLGRVTAEPVFARVSAPNHNAAAMDGIMVRGGAKLGDKTLLDAISPAVLMMEERSGSADSLIEVFDKAAEAAYAAIEGTKGWCAKRGRQAFTGDRSIGTVDPGTVAVGTMAREIVKALRR